MRKPLLDDKFRGMSDSEERIGSFHMTKGNDHRFDKSPTNFLTVDGKISFSED
jgi:hypothetical protein